MKKSILILASVIVALALVGYVVLKEFYPAYYPSWYWLNPLFFLLSTGVLFFVVFGKNGLSIRKYLITKAVKLPGGVLLLTSYFVFVTTNVISMVLIMSLFYIVYTVFETKILLDANKKKTNHEKQEPHI
ncbi:MAG: hypothetical protein LBC40_06335 [Dysgonamonadaceae bacterium]|jgi:hypothetical protein|nr:hypothetical protein [Dysgonamonadaceae bacterium]